ncbi:MAG: hypothetical protein LBN06_03700 [Prevotellaceae bacterium]|jgi:hypothetical protein|nr:hypothetical protein [Prevotellaceae bacterium]
MANRRSLKKQVKQQTRYLLHACTVVYITTPNIDKEVAEDILEQIIRYQSEFITRINHTEPGNVKLYYKKLHDEFSTQGAAIWTEIHQMALETEA